MVAPTIEEPRGAAAIEEPRGAAAGPQVTATLDGIEVTQAIQDLGGSIPLIAGKRTFVRAYLGLPSGTVSVRGELRVARKANGPWTTVSSFGAANLDVSRSGSTPAQLRSRREDLSFSLDFRLPHKFSGAGPTWFRLGKVWDASNGQAVQITGMVAARTVTFLKSPKLRLRVINLRYTAGTPPVQYAATKNDLEHLESWLTRAYPVAEVTFSSITVPAKFTAPFNNNNFPTTADQANAQLTALKALDVAGGRDPGTHYYGMVTDGGDWMRGKADSIPVAPDPNDPASGPTGVFKPGPGFGWDTDGSYGDWYGGHEVAHTFGRRHPGFCNNNSSNDPAYPFTSGQLANADGAFTGLDVGDSNLGILPAALPGTTWHDIMTYCDNEWLSSYTYAGIRDRLVAEEMLFPDPDDDDDDDGSGERTSGEGTMNGTPIHVSAVVNLTRHSAQIAYVTPLPGPSPQLSVPVDDRLALRVHMPDGSTRREPVVFKPSVCQQPDDDETGLVDTVAVVDPAAVRLELLLDGDPIATYEPGEAPGVAENLRVERGAAAGPADSDVLPTDGTVLTWEDSSSATATGGAGAAGTRYAVQASTDNGRTWTTLAVGTTDRSLQLDPEPFSDATQVRFRVLTTNGFVQTIATTSDIAVESL